MKCYRAVVSALVGCCFTFDLWCCSSCRYCLCSIVDYKVMDLVCYKSDGCCVQVYILYKLFIFMLFIFPTLWLKMKWRHWMTWKYLQRYSWADFPSLKRQHLRTLWPFKEVFVGPFALRFCGEAKLQNLMSTNIYSFSYFL